MRTGVAGGEWLGSGGCFCGVQMGTENVPEASPGEMMSVSIQGNAAGSRWGVCVCVGVSTVGGRVGGSRRGADPRIVILSEVRQTQKDQYPMRPHTRGILEKKDTQNLIYRTGIDSQIWTTNMVISKGERGREG